MFAAVSGRQVKDRDAWPTVLLFNPFAIPLARSVTKRRVNGATVMGISLAFARLGMQQLRATVRLWNAARNAAGRR